MVLSSAALFDHLGTAVEHSLAKAEVVPALTGEEIPGFRLGPISRKISSAMAV